MLQSYYHRHPQNWPLRVICQQSRGRSSNGKGTCGRDRRVRDQRSEVAGHHGRIGWPGSGAASIRRAAASIYGTKTIWKHPLAPPMMNGVPVTPTAEPTGAGSPNWRSSRTTRSSTRRLAAPRGSSVSICSVRSSIRRRCSNTNSPRANFWPATRGRCERLRPEAAIRPGRRRLGTGVS